MNSRETSLWSWFSKDFKKTKNLDWQRVENGAKGGTPDAEICDEGIVTWIELKVAEPRKTEGNWTTKFRPLQVPWLKRRWNKGGRCYVLIRAGSSHFLVRGCDAGETEGTHSYSDLRKLSIVNPETATPKDILDACKAPRIEA